MGTVDIVILVIVLAGAVVGAFKGFISQFVSIASLILGIWGASSFTPAAAGYLKEFLKMSETTLHIVCFVILLLVIIAICGIIGRGIEKIIHLSLLGWLNRILGLIFAAMKVVIILSLLTVLVGYVQKTWGALPENMFSGSQLYPHLTDIADKFCPVLQSLLK